MTGSSILSVGYRPFFWLAALNAVASIATWLAFLSGLGVGTQGWPPHVLHAHEMIHGTVVAAIAGFLLTAVPNWCGTRPLRGAPLGALLALWVLGRLALLAGEVVPSPLVAGLDCLFLPVLAVVLGLPIARSGKLRNLSVVGVLLALAAANSAMHAGLMRPDPQLLRMGMYGSVYLAVVLMLIIGGRVIPLFTRNSFRRDGLDIEVQSNRWIGGSAIAATFVALGFDLVLPASRASGVVAVAASALLLARQWPWKSGNTLNRPILWILHLGHAWIAIGFACHAAAKLGGWMPPTAALHAFTAGAMGSMILGMMGRVSLGHGGRPIEASGFTVVSYMLVVAGGLVRVFGPLVTDATHYMLLLHIGGCAFSAGYLIFAIEFASILWTPARESA
ncbi:MAG: NnrS family protein [bacterium]|nr:NnrS family protein [bacterium]